MKILYEDLQEKTVMEIGKFTVLWGFLEREKFGNNCNPAQIKERIDKGVVKRDQLKEEQLKELSSAFQVRRDLAHLMTVGYVEDGLHPNNAHISSEENKKLMEDFIDFKGEDLLTGALLVIHRIRNNLMHGLKMISELDNQITLFQEINKFLEELLGN